MGGETDSQLVNSVYIDNYAMELYHGRLDKTPGAIALRFRWYGTGTPDTVFTSLDGGATWRQRNSTVAYSPPCWQPAPGQSQLLPFGRNNIVVSSRRPGVWLLSTGFGVASSADGGDTWGWSSAGLGEVVTFRCHSHPSTANWTFCGAGDLTGFIIADAGASPKALAVFAHEPTR
jgi:hypothetical protein